MESHIVHALVQGRHRPGATKVTGTGSGGDYRVMLDAGALRMLDFTDVGLASTYRVDFPVVEHTSIELLDQLTAAGCGAIAVEIADGLLQRESATLPLSDAFRERVGGIVIAAPDAMGAVGSLMHLRELGLRVTAIAGRLTTRRWRPGSPRCSATSPSSPSTTWTMRPRSRPVPAPSPRGRGGTSGGAVPGIVVGGPRRRARLRYRW